MNPFEPTDTFNEQKQAYLVKQEEKKQQNLELEKQRKLALLAQQQAEEKEAQLEAQHAQQIELEKQRKIQERKKAQILKIAHKRKKIVIPKDSYKILPFVHISLSKNSLEIFIDKRYKLINQDILEDQKKFLFDFRATESFYTVRKLLKHKDFKACAVGAHTKKNFFRVVVDLKESVSKYKEHINSNNNSIKISKIK